MLVFRKVSWKNFIATGNIPTVIELDTTPSTILLGESGSGKTTFLDAIAFALFNKPFRSINKNSLVNAINQKDCLVEIEFTIGSNNYRVVRGIKPNIFEIYHNGELLNQDASALDYQAFLERKILKCNYRSFTQVIMLGASNFTPFMLLKPADRRLIIEELLDIQIFSSMNTLLKQRVSSTKAEFEKNESDIKILNEKILVHEKYLANLKQDTINEIQVIETKIEENKKHLDDFTAQMLVIQKDIDTTLELLNFEEEVNAKLKDLSDLESKLEDKSTKTKKELAFYEKNNDCPTCKQHINQEFKTSEIEKKKIFLNEIVSGLAKVEENRTKFEEKKSTAKQIRINLEALEAKKFKLKSQFVGIETYISKLEKELVALRKPKMRVEEEAAVLDEYKNQIKTLELEKQELIKEKNLNEVAASLLKDTGVKSRIIKQYLPLINKYTNKYLQDMSFFVTFSMNENFEEAIKSRGRDDFSYGNFSDGEKQRLNLALLFTWREIAKIKNSVNTNLLILDEIADSYLDLESTENILQLLSSSIFKHMNIILISHKNTISDKFDRVIRFRKEKSFSKVEM